MDIFSHGLWAYALYFKSKYRFWAAFLAVLPDLISFGPYFVYRLITGGLHLEKPNIENIPDYVFAGYNLGHSLVIFLIVIGVIYYITRSIPIAVGGWLSHILLDIPTHTTKFFPTPFLWPISDFKFNGISWGNPVFMIINYGLLFILYVYLFTKVKKN